MLPLPASCEASSNELAGLASVRDAFSCQAGSNGVVFFMP